MDSSYIPITASGEQQSISSRKRGRSPIYLILIFSLLIISFLIPIYRNGNLDKVSNWADGQIEEYKSRFGYSTSGVVVHLPTEELEDLDDEYRELGVSVEELEEDPVPIDWEIYQMAKPKESELDPSQKFKIDLETEIKKNATDKVVTETSKMEAVMVKVQKPTTPVCERTILYSLKSKHGFASEFSMAVRISAVAKSLNYNLILDSDQWNYGSFSDYFLPINLSCSLPSPNIKRFSVGTGVKEGPLPSWHEEPHLLWKRDFEWMDSYILDLFVDPEELIALHLRDGQTGSKSPLTAVETLPPAFEEIYLKMSSAIQELWRPNEEIQLMCDQLMKKVPESESSEKEAGEITIGIHVRLGDKYMETSKIGPPKTSRPKLSSKEAASLSSGRLTPYLAAATSIIDSVVAPPDLLESAAWKGQPLLLVMSDDSNTWMSIRDNSQSKAFHVIGTEFENRRDDELINGFSETTFNKLPLARRITLTKSFIRDMTVLSRHTDGLIFTGSSNVGRLMLLLMGKQKVLAEGRGRSTDIRWFPGSKFS